MLKPGAVIGILGGGQLGRMLALAGARLGLRSHIYAPEADSPAFQVVESRMIAAYEDEAALAAFAAAVDVATYEFENVPVGAVEFLEARLPVSPGSKALRICQDRVAEKSLALELEAKTARFAAIEGVADLAGALATVGLPAILKTRRFGYDGKGQVKIAAAHEAEAAFDAIGRHPAILESVVPFDCEISVVAAHGGGAFAAYEPIENEHRNHILHRSTVPARIPGPLAEEAIAIARRIGAALDYVGVFAVEFFVWGGDLCVNEIAPRVHNSGHWTLDGAETSQFEQHIRAVAGWPLGGTARLAPNVTMTNIVGEDAYQWYDNYLRESGARLHVYGKSEARPGRKMGHVTLLSPRHP